MSLSEIRTVGPLHASDGAHPRVLPRRVRLAAPDDFAWLLQAAALALRPWGDYAGILGAWLAQPRVYAWIGCQGEARTALAMVRMFRLKGAVAWQCELLALAVCSAHRGQGWGHTLLAAVLSAVAEASPYSNPAVELAVDPCNVVARSLYQAHGFVVMGQAGAYPNGQPALKMLRPPGAAVATR